MAWQYRSRPLSEKQERLALNYDRSQVDLTNCDREPIHIPGSIQPDGAMIVVDNDTGLVSFVSDNIGEYLGDTNRDYEGLELPELVGSKVAHDVANAITRAGPGQIAAVVLHADLGHDQPPADITVHRYEGRTFLEFEPPASAIDTEKALHLTKSLVRRLDTLTDLDQAARMVARLVRSVFEYDRVMVYRFLHNGAGRVVAEAKDPALQSFMGQHFPVSDIPVQARTLYVKNWVRVIGDVSFVPVPLTPLLKDGEQPVDMSFAHLRSVSPIHCEYLQNMGVAASMSISIVVDGKLWGLIACHHNTPKWLSIPLRVATELFAQYFSMHVAALENRQEKVSAENTRKRLDAIIAGIDATEPVERSLGSRLREFSSLIACDGAGLWSGGNWASYGVSPDPALMPELLGLIGDAGTAVFDTQDLRGLTGNTKAYGTEIAGLLAIQLSQSSSEYLVFFRSEEAHEIEWAGEPRKQAVSSVTGERLTPRGSFETWREDVRYKSLPWTEEDVSVAQTIRGYVRDVMLSHNDATEEQRQRTDGQRSLLNAELNHRVKNILALVKSIAAQTGANAETVDEYADSFEGRLRALSYAHDQSFAGADGGELRGLIEAEAGMHRYGRLPDRIEMVGPAVGLTERAFGVFALLLHEMMTNASKYGSLSLASGRLRIEWKLDDAGCEITWSESGGPAVVAPTRRGFGSTLIEKTVSHDLGGTVSIEYAPEGLQASFVIPVEHLHEIAEPTRRAEPTLPSERRILEGLKVLLVEDQSLIALDTEELLLALGASEVTVAATAESAVELVGEIEIDCAVLDLNLGNGTSEPVAVKLSKLGIPFIFATGYRDSASIPIVFSEVPVVRKPVAEAGLAIALSRALRSGDTVETLG